MPSIHRIARHEFACSAITSRPVPGRRLRPAPKHISQPYRFEIELVSDDPEIDFSERHRPASATLTMYRGDDPSEVDGIVTSTSSSSHQTGETVRVPLRLPG